MSDLVRRLRSWLFGTRYVVLVDFDGERHVRQIRFVGGKPYANRFEYVGRQCWLEDNGALTGQPAYVDRWEPYIPGAPGRFPVYSAQS
ncbi:MAG: hypothetical protein E5X10_01935 [Mesorhizobium sp.]|nr:MAG: hypothetical protein E5X10_01935 [Mesorhizobium sp.]